MITLMITLTYVFGVMATTPFVARRLADSDNKCRRYLTNPCHTNSRTGKQYCRENHTCMDGVVTPWDILTAMFISLLFPLVSTVAILTKIANRKPTPKAAIRQHQERLEVLESENTRLERELGVGKYAA